LSEQIKSAETSYFTSFRSLLIFDICLLACEMTVLELFVFMSIIICFLEEYLVVMLNFSLSFNPLLLVMLWISIILLENNFGKVFLILIIFLIIPLEACAYKWLFRLEAWAYDQLFEFNDWLFLKYLNLAKTLLLGLKEMEGEILKMLAYLFFVGFRISIGFVGFLLNWDKTYYLKDISYH